MVDAKACPTYNVIRSAPSAEEAQAHRAVGLACLATCSATMASVGLSGMLPACDCAPHSRFAQRRIADSHAGAGCDAMGMVGACLLAHLVPGQCQA